MTAQKQSMVNKATLGKRDREKIKENKRQEKLKRRERNKSEGTKSFDDMIAYVDAYGNLHSTPPEVVVEETDSSTIEISTARRDEVEDPTKHGVVDHFNSSKGYGFIKEDVRGDKIFFHISSAYPEIETGDKVTFITEKGFKGLNAINITKNK